VTTTKQLLFDLNGRWHAYALLAFMAGVVAHISEHVTQAIQIYLLGWATPDARGLLGEWWPWLATSESLHYFYAVFTLFGIVLLLPAFQGRARLFWYAAFVFQFWHHFEHLLLVYQHVSGHFLFGGKVPTGVGQILVGRVLLHDIYNALVLIPMLIALYYHFHAAPENEEPICSCSVRHAQAVPSALTPTRPTP
jgi:hypothetical protein